MEFGVDLDQTAVDLGQEMTWNFRENPCHIFYRVSTILRQEGFSNDSKFQMNVILNIIVVQKCNP